MANWKQPTNYGIPMLNELRKSIASILYERTTSPLFGTLIVSWLVINWRIPYLTLFVSEETIKPISKIDFILANYSDPKFIYYLPLASAFLLLTVVPLISIGAFWLQQFFRSKRINIKNRIAGETPINQNQYVAMTDEIRRKDDEFKNALAARQEEIEVHRKSISEKEIRIRYLESVDLNFKVLHAKYGVGKYYDDVTDTLTKLIGPDGKVLEFIVDDRLFTHDPAPGSTKFIDILYRRGGTVVFSQYEYGAPVKIIGVPLGVNDEIKKG